MHRLCSFSPLKLQQQQQAERELTMRTRIAVPKEFYNDMNRETALRFQPKLDKRAVEGGEYGLLSLFLSLSSSSHIRLLNIHSLRTTFR